MVHIHRPTVTRSFNTQVTTLAAANTLAPLQSGEMVTFIGHTTNIDGFRANFVYSPLSALTIDGVFVLAAPTGQPGRLINAQRDLLDLEYAGLTNGADITTLLTNAAPNFAGGIVRIRMPRSLTNLICNYVAFPANLDLFEVLAGGPCTITQKSDATSAIMWELFHPKNVNIESGIEFVGRRHAPNIVASGFGLIYIDGAGRTTGGGSIKCLANFTSTTTAGFGVGENETLAEAYDVIEIRGAYEDSLAQSNHVVKNLIMDVAATDPDGYGYEDTPVEQAKCRGIGFGQVIDSINVNYIGRFGNARAFSFAHYGAAGQINLNVSKFGYGSDNELLPVASINEQIFKFDTLGETADITVNIVESGNATQFNFIAAEASPGPTNNVRFRCLTDVGNLHMMSVSLQSGDNLENFGTKVEQSALESIWSGLVGKVENTTTKNLTVQNNTDGGGGPSPLPDTDYTFSVGCEFNSSTIRDNLYLQIGTHATFCNCNLPERISLINTLASGDTVQVPRHTIYNFEDCRFPTGTDIDASALIAPITLANSLRLGFSGTNTGLAIENIPVQSLPYLRLDAIAHPKFDFTEFPANENTFDRYSRKFETINRPVGWKTTGKASGVAWSGASAIATPSASRSRIIGINKHSCVGSLVWPTMSTTTTLGSLMWDLGVSEGTAEAAITFKSGGAPRGGLLARTTHDNSVLWAYLDEENNLLAVDLGTVGSPASTSIAISNDVEYILKLVVDATNYTATVATGGAVIATLGPTAHGAGSQTKWGIKHGGDNGTSLLDENGPLWRYIEVRPNDDDDAVEAERHTL